MDPATLIGIGAAFAAIFASMFMEGGNPMAIVLIPPIILVFGGTIGAAVAGGVMHDAKALPKTIIAAIKAKPVACDDTVDLLVSLADKARREGLLAMESQLSEIEDPFLKRALEMAVDGTDPEQVEEILGMELDAHRSAGQRAAKVLSDMGGYAPTIGIIGTVLGLVHVLSNLGSPDELGKEIASAFVATLWGVLSANVLWFPLSNRTKRLTELECERMEVTIEGVLAIQAGSNPRLVAQKLRSLVPATDRTAASADDTDQEAA